MTDFTRVQEILSEALELDAHRRRAFVASACGDNAALEREVWELLEAHAKPVSLVDQPLVHRLAGERTPGLAAPEPLPTGPGVRRVGPYRIVREIGSGGMGLVVEAEQQEPVRRRVALKLIKPGMDSREVTRRFEMERQTLFSLEHPQIARAYDAGVTDLGRPYFVMELVDGEPITDYCDRRALGLRERLRLFATLCRAVQYAHLRGIIHRDLKPSNILVAEAHDGPALKVIDFGIAKALGGHEGTALTRLAQPIGTPETMSPEQAAGTGVDIRTDVYSAGVLLYRLLCGDYPLRPEELRHSDWASVVRVLETSVPDPPRLRARRAGRAAPGLDPGELGRARELDWITLRAIARDPDRRYQSMEELAADIERFLRHEAVEAGPETRSYRALKFVERHRAGVAVATLVVLLVMGAAVALAIQAARLRVALAAADTERSQAEQVTSLIAGILSGADPFAEGRRDVTALELLTRGESSVRDALAGQPEVLAELLEVMGAARHSLGDDERAGQLLEEAVALRRERGAEENLAKALNVLAAVRDAQARYQDASTLSREAVAAARTAGDPATLVTALQMRSQALQQTGHNRQAEDTLDEALALAETSAGVSEQLRRAVRQSRAILWRRLGRGEEALDEVLALLAAERRSPTAAGYAARLRSMAGGQLIDLGRSREALPYLETALAEQVSVLGPAHPRTMVTRSNMALAASNVGDLELARDMNLESLEAWRSVVPGPHAQTALLLNNLGLNQHGLGDLEAAEASFREALEIQRAVVGDDHPNLAFHLTNLARVLQERGRSAEAERLYRRALALREKHLPADHPNRSDTEVWLGALLVETGRPQEALGHLQRGVEIREQKLAPGGWRAAEARSWLGTCLIALGRAREGLPLVVKAYSIVREQRGDHWHRTPAALQRVIEAYEAVGDKTQADAYRQRRAELYGSQRDG